MTFFKILLLFVAISLFITDDKVLFEMNLQSQALGQFSELKSSNTAQITTDANNQKIITFDGLSRYGGMVFKDWIESPSHWYHLTFKFHGVQGKRTGAFIGYVSFDNESIIHSIAMDQDQLMDNYQLFIFNNADSQWHEYEAYINGGSKIKLVLEKGNYYGLTEDLDAAFKDIEVQDADFSSECPGDDSALKQAYFAKIYNSSDYPAKINQNIKLNDDKTEAILTIKFPTLTIPCIKSQLYVFDKNNAVINSIIQDETSTTENSETIVQYSFSFDYEKLMGFNCYQTEIDCPKGYITPCLRHQCYFDIHFYVQDSSRTFSTKSQEYGYTKVNNAAVINSMFVVNSGTKLINAMIQIPSLERPCGDSCQLNTDVSLEIYIKNAKGQWLPKDVEFYVVWGDDVTFMITCTPSNYRLTFYDIYLIHNDGTAISLGFDFIKNFDNSVNGQMIFTMPMSTESGLTKGDPFNFYFLVYLEELTSRRIRRRSLGAVFSSEELPEAALTNNKNNFQFINECSSKLSCISSSCANSDHCICKDSESCAIIKQCNATNCTCDAISDMTGRCELIECVRNYGCINCGCGSGQISYSETSKDGSSSSIKEAINKNASDTSDKYAGIWTLEFLALLVLLIFI